MTKLTVVFFASLRETLNTDGLEIELEGSLTVFDLKQLLAQRLNQPILLEDTVKTAIDFDFARDTDVIDVSNVKEVAFFPPVTGG